MLPLYQPCTKSWSRVGDINNLFERDIYLQRVPNFVRAVFVLKATAFHISIGWVSGFLLGLDIGRHDPSSGLFIFLELEVLLDEL